MTDTALITNAQLIANSPLGGNIDVDKYSAVIKETQIFDIEPVLGTKLYNKILSDFEGDTLAGDYLELHTNYIVPVLVHSVAAEYITISGFQVANGGIFRYSPQDALPATKEEIDFLANKERSKAEVYLQRMQKWLCDKNLTEYVAAQDENYDVRPDRDLRKFGGWRLSGRNDYSTNAERELWRDIYYDEGK